MPLTTSLPAPSIEWVQKMFGPVALQNPTSAFGQPGQRISADRSAQQVASGVRTVQSATRVQAFRYDTYQTVGSSLANVWDGIWGRGAMAMNSTNNNGITGSALVPPDWMPSLTPVQGQNPGSQQDAASLVAVFDFHLFYQIPAAPTWTNNAAGIWFTPYNVACDCRSLAISSAVLPFNTKFSGFGVFLNTVAGTAGYEYVSWRATSPPTVDAVVLESVPVPTSVVPDVNSWNSIRFVIVGARNAEPATLSVQVNGQDLIPVRTFGSPELVTPEADISPAPGMVCGFNTAGPAFCWGTFHAKLGRFTPGGVAVEPA